MIVTPFVKYGTYISECFRRGYPAHLEKGCSRVLIQDLRPRNRKTHALARSRHRWSLRWALSYQCSSLALSTFCLKQLMACRGCHGGHNRKRKRRRRFSADRIHCAATCHIRLFHKQVFSARDVVGQTHWRTWDTHDRYAIRQALHIHLWMFPGSVSRQPRERMQPRFDTRIITPCDAA